MYHPHDKFNKAYLQISLAEPVFWATNEVYMTKETNLQSVKKILFLHQSIKKMNTNWVIIKSLPFFRLSI